MAKPKGDRTTRAGGAQPTSPSATRSNKPGPHAFRLDPVRLAAARRALGTPNDTPKFDAFDAFDEDGGA